MSARVMVVVVAYGTEPWLIECVDAILASTGVEVDLVVVDNGVDPAVADRFGACTGFRVLTPGRNTGYAEGCNLGAATGDAPWLALVNPDALVAPTALAELVAAAEPQGVGIVTASVRLADDPELLNSAGNPVHLTGLVWAGGHGQPAATYRPCGPVAAASGAGLLLPRSLWDSLGGFAPQYFAYHEDTELSLRIWQRGLRVAFADAALVAHHYEFARRPGKFALLERNRLLVVLTVYPAAVLAVLTPILLATELAILIMAGTGGWAGQKVAGWCWIIRHAGWVRARRRLIRTENRLDDATFAALLTDTLTPTNLSVPSMLWWVQAPVRWYWAAARRLLRGARRPVGGARGGRHGRGGS